MSMRRTILVATILAAGLCLAQFRPDNSGNLVRIEGGLVVNEDELLTARETDTHSTGTPNWTNASGFEQDVFTFTRVIFSCPRPALVPDLTACDVAACLDYARDLAEFEAAPA